MTIRLIDRSYIVGGQFFSDLSPRPSFEHSYSLYSYSSFVLLSMFSTSFITHYNAPRFYSELKNPTPERFANVSMTAFFISMLFFILVMGSGFLTFGATAQSFVLNNYSPRDSLAIYARLATGLAVITGYPFTFAAFRDNLQDLWNGDQTLPRHSTALQNKEDDFFLRTVILLGTITTLSLLFDDVGVVVGISGALFGSWLLFIVPGMMNLAFFQRQMQFRLATTKMGLKRPTWSMPQQIEMAWNYVLVGIGVILMVVGLSVHCQRLLL